MHELDRIIYDFCKDIGIELNLGNPAHRTAVSRLKLRWENRRERPKPATPAIPFRVGSQFPRNEA